MTAALVAAVLVSGLFAAFAPAASAIVFVSYTPSGDVPGVHISGDANNNDVRVDMAGSNTMRVRTPVDSSGTDMRAEGGCTAGTATSTDHGTLREVQCNLTGARNVRAFLNLGNDRLNVLGVGINGPCACSGNEGVDTINGTASADLIFGGPGSDFLNGEPGNDRIEGGDGDDIHHAGFDSGSDVFQGGVGRDTAGYFAADTVTVSLDGVANDGIPGEGDNIMADVENVEGGFQGDDVLLGNGASNRLEGLDGNDTLRGAGGNDTLDGGLGTDVLDAGGGDDLLLARDGVDDQTKAPLACGAGFDVLRADLKDDGSRRLPGDCENINQSDRREGPNVVVRSRSVSVSRDGVMSVRLACPRKLTKRCAGTLASRLDKRGKSFGRRTRYSIRPGRSAKVKTRLRASQHKAARRRGARVQLRSLERGLHGPKTTLRSLRARRG